MEDLSHQSVNGVLSVCSITDTSSCPCPPSVSSLPAGIDTRELDRKLGYLTTERINPFSLSVPTFSSLFPRSFSQVCALKHSVSRTKCYSLQISVDYILKDVMQ